MAEKTELKSLGYEIFIGILSIFSIFNIVVGFLITRHDINNILYDYELALQHNLLCDFTYRILTAPSKSGYFFSQFGWADLLASLPFEQTKILRIFRLVRVYRLMRTVGPKKDADTLRQRPGRKCIDHPAPNGVFCPGIRKSGES